MTYITEASLFFPSEKLTPNINKKLNYQYSNNIYIMYHATENLFLLYYVYSEITCTLGKNRAPLTSP